MGDERRRGTLSLCDLKRLAQGGKGAYAATSWDRPPPPGGPSRAGLQTCRSSLRTTVPSSSPELPGWPTAPASLSPTGNEWGEAAGRHKEVSVARTHEQMHPAPGALRETKVDSGCCGGWWTDPPLLSCKPLTLCLQFWHKSLLCGQVLLWVCPDWLMT